LADCTDKPKWFDDDIDPLTSSETLSDFTGVYVQVQIQGD